MNATGGYKVLIVSEEHANSQSLAQVFSLRGNNIRTAYTAEQAIEIVAAWGLASQSSMSHFPK